MTDRRESDVALVLADLGDEPEIGTAAAKAACFCGDYVVAEATTYNNSRILTFTLEIPLLLIVPESKLRLPEFYSLCGREPAR
jgi:hypothetical protein